MASRPIPLAIVFVGLFSIAAAGQSSRDVIALPFEYCVVGAPLTATRTLDYEPAQNSSDPVKVHRDGTLYRDSQGRTRTELNYPDHESIFLQDCVAGFRYQWRAGDSVALREPMKHVGHTYDTAVVPKLDDGNDTVAIERVPTHHSFRALKETEGKVEQFSESWYAPSLDLYLVSVFYTANVGKTTSRIFNLRLAEPDPTLFQAPAGMTIKTDGPIPPAKLQ